ncbi:DUF3105 domain-containing protein [Nocardia yamanashiensis]|uniref:DUF3105 domain-containing protein n=1 Tax=Nocardia yamanashiensis TaxID=209247 RepID=UPI001E51C26B|nr:DUF3105 domain-containing protein [Nocardia yamanashiensis]UGT39404.1 DUF3105 domain-containing protein [Nocardia yamanashiensis]
MPSRTSAKSAKAIKAAGKSAPSKKRGGGGKVGGKRQIPWLTIAAVVSILALIGGIAAYLVPKYNAKEELKNPSAYIDGIVKKDYPAGLHVASAQRVAYDQAPPFGGPHDGSWADCMGTVYEKAIRTENAVHSLEHGAVWIAYNPDKVDAAGIDTLKQKVAGKPYSLMSPYPGLDAPVALMSWGHQLKVQSVSDSRVDRFIKDLRLNEKFYPEVGASCSNPTFDTKNPPAFDASAPGPDAVPMDGKGATKVQNEGSGGLGSIPGMPGGLTGLPGGLTGIDPTGGLGGAGLTPEGVPSIPNPAEAPQTEPQAGQQQPGQ